MEELISVITPAYNSAAYIGQAIESVVKQTYKNWEMIIVDDCSADNTEAIIAQYNDPRIRYARNTTNLGAAATRNKALQLAAGRFVAFLDSDDVWQHNKLEQQIGFMRRHGYAFTYHDYTIISQEGYNLNKHIHCPKSLDYQHYLSNTAIGCLTVMLDRQQTGPLHFPAIRTSQDMALWLQILKQGIVAYNVGQPLAMYRIVNNSGTSNKLRAAHDVWRVYRNIEHLPLLTSMRNFIGYAYHAIAKRL